MILIYRILRKETVRIKLRIDRERNYNAEIKDWQKISDKSAIINGSHIGPIWSNPLHPRGKRNYIERVSSRWQDISRWNNEAQPVGVKSRMRWWQEGYPDSLSKVPAQYCLSTGVGARTASQPAETRSVVVGPDNESPRATSASEDDGCRAYRLESAPPTRRIGASPINQDYRWHAAS